VKNKTRKKYKSADVERIKGRTEGMGQWGVDKNKIMEFRVLPNPKETLITLSYL